jgi:flagellar hook-length control protein FliK
VASGQVPASDAAMPGVGATAALPGMDMQEMIDAIHATVELAARQGASHARIALQPAELGEIRVHLSQSSDGLLARVTADTPAAAQTLLAGRAELHQSLSSLGTVLLRLDIGSSGQPGGEQGRGAGWGAPTDRAGARARGEAIASASEIDGGTGGPQETAVPRHPLGEMVDVLA